MSNPTPNDSDPASMSKRWRENKAALEPLADLPVGEIDPAERERQIDAEQDEIEWEMGVVALQEQGVMTIAERIASFLRHRAGATFCDDCIADALELPRRQEAQAVASALGTTPSTSGSTPHAPSVAAAKR